MRVCLRPLPLVELPSNEERRSSTEGLFERVVEVGDDGPPLVMGMLLDVAVGDEAGEITFSITFLSADMARKRKRVPGVGGTMWCVSYRRVQSRGVVRPRKSLQVGGEE